MSAIYLRERKLPTYDDLVEPYYSGRYNPSFEFDHVSPSRGKYRTHDGIKVYESGYVEVSPYTSRSPDMRRTLDRQYGLVFCPPSDCRGVKFFTPDNVPVATSAITTGMLFMDGQAGRAYSFERKWETNPREKDQIDFAAPGAVPVAHAMVHAKLSDHARVKAVMQEHKEFFKVCATTMLLTQGSSIDALDAKTVSNMSTSTVFEMMLRGEELGLAAIPLNTMVRIGEYVTGKADVGIRARLTALSVKPFTFPYLKFDTGGVNG